jgi:hypothetical protein
MFRKNIYRNLKEISGITIDKYEFTGNQQAR